MLQYYDFRFVWYDILGDIIIPWYQFMSRTLKLIRLSNLLFYWMVWPTQQTPYLSFSYRGLVGKVKMQNHNVFVGLLMLKLIQSFSPRKKENKTNCLMSNYSNLKHKIFQRDKFKRFQLNNYNCFKSLLKSIHLLYSSALILQLTII